MPLGNGNTPRTPSGEGASPVRCVLVCPGGPAAAPADLLESLSRRSLEVLPCRNVFEAMAVLAASERAIRRGAVRRPTALLIVEPLATPRADELAKAIERFAPRVARWRYDADASPRLRAYTIERPAPQVVVTPAARTAVAARAASMTAEPPRLRLTGEGEPPTVGSGASWADEDDSSAGRASEMLTEEELSMLLSGEPDDHPLPARPQRPVTDPREARP